MHDFVLYVEILTAKAKTPSPEPTPPSPKPAVEAAAELKPPSDLHAPPKEVKLVDLSVSTSKNFT